MIFISHHNEDDPKANDACAYLEKRGFKCWIDHRNAKPGSLWEGSIVTAIENSKIFFLIFTNKANKSDHVSKELSLAVKNKLAIIPFKFEDVIPNKNIEYNLSNIHWHNAINSPIDNHLPELLANITRTLEEKKEKKDAYCILCGKSISDNMRRPFCKDCHYDNAIEIEQDQLDYKNLYCHICGKKADLSKTVPYCNKCELDFPDKLPQKTFLDMIEGEEKSFRGTIIQESEAKFLQEIENELDQEFTGDKTSVLMTIPGWEHEIFFDENEMLFLVEDKKVVRLSVHDKKLTSIPESIENLENLLQLDLSGNQLESLIESIGNLSILDFLDLRNNRLKSLPESIGNLKNLEYLYLDGNQLKELPHSLTELNSLREIVLADNPLSERSKNILEELRDDGKMVLY